MPQMVYFYVIKQYMQVCKVLKQNKKDMALYIYIYVSAMCFFISMKLFLLKLLYTCVFKPLSIFELAMFV